MKVLDAITHILKLEGFRSGSLNDGLAEEAGCGRVDRSRAARQYSTV